MFNTITCPEKGIVRQPVTQQQTRQLLDAAATSPIITRLEVDGYHVHFTITPKGHTCISTLSPSKGYAPSPNQQP